MSEFENKKILIIGESEKGTSMILDEILKKIKNYILFEDIKRIDKVEDALDKFDYKTIIVSTNKVKHSHDLKKYNVIIFLKNSDKKTIEIAREDFNFKIDDLEEFRYKTYHQKKEKTKIICLTNSSKIKEVYSA